MRKTLHLVSLIAGIALIMMMVSCSKEGPQGPAGPAGPAGPQGSAGAQGQQGPAGTANVYYSQWIDVNFDPAVDQAGDTIAWTAEISATRLTKPILDSGAVKVYLNAGSSATPAVFPLPITDIFAITGVLNLNVYFTLNKINMYTEVDASTFTDQGTKYFQYRYIIIPGGVPAGRQGVDWNNYESVKAYLGLKD
jgi:hypothetical protein